jgi:hypothetical protein
VEIKHQLDEHLDQDHHRAKPTEVLPDPPRPDRTVAQDHVLDYRTLHVVEQASRADGGGAAARRSGEVPACRSVTPKRLIVLKQRLCSTDPDILETGIAE